MEEQVVENTWLQKPKKFYINNFPSDKPTCNLMLALISMVLSGLNFIVLTHNIPYVDILPGYCVCFVFTIVMCGINYMFYHGLLLDDHRQISPWFVVKLLEIIGCIGTVPLIITPRGWWVSYYFRVLIPFTSFIALNILMVLCMSLKVKQMKRENDKNNLSSEHIEPITPKEKEEKKTETT